MTQPIAKRADQIVVGDRIPDEHLAFRFNQGPAEVVFVAHEHTATLPWIFAAYRYPNGQHDSMTIRPEAVLQVYPAAGVETTQPIAGRAPQPIARHYDASDEWTNECACGESFDTVGHLNRHIEAANAVPLVNEGGHTAVATAGGLIEIDPPWNPETGFFEPGRVPAHLEDARTGEVVMVGGDRREVRCALSDPHAPHRTTFAPELGIANGICPGRCTQDCIDLAVHGAPQDAHKGWHDDDCPAVIDIADVR